MKHFALSQTDTFVKIACAYIGVAVLGGYIRRNRGQFVSRNLLFRRYVWAFIGV